MTSEFIDAFADLSASLDQGAEVVLELDIDLIDPDPDQPRDSFDEAEDAAMAETIREKGVLQPITVRPQAGNGRYFIRYGERRWRNSKLAGRKTIRALLHTGPDTDADRLYEQIIENDQRAPLSTAQLAKSVERLMAMGETQAAIGQRLGRAKDQITMLKAVTTMPPPLKALAPQLGVRALYELNQAWKVDADEVAGWLDGRDPASITQAEARRLSARLAESDRDAVLEGRSRAKPGAPRKPATKPQAPALGRDTIVIEVSVKGRAGHLVLRAGAKGVAYVQFESGEPEAVKVSQIQLASVRKA